ncbi:S-layer homology domain-containing protein [Caminicella sporogenes]|uniref:S-layer homology domain-containing protein n=1 Tax=Caminicella sporogenes TaxID=166485 RepID=UPI00253FB3AA|nr:S-layer homology domain-containing protein [Caminicella sporogenes]WIF95959.1 S-layer homology domain-containing protein [Caminicella sporogenes]
MKKVSVLLIGLLVAIMPLIVFAEKDANITKAEFVKKVVKARNLELEEVLQSSFEDVTNPDYINYIETAFKAGIISGSNKKFNPEDVLTKEQAIVILVKAFGEKGKVNSVTKDTLDNQLKFIDKNKITPWAQNYIAYALESGIVKESESFLHPKMLVTEELADKMIQQARNVFEKKYMRDGMSAADMLVMVNEKTMKYKTYKQKGNMNMKMSVKVEGLPEEVYKEDLELQNLLKQGMNMVVNMELQVQNPDKSYVKESIEYDNEELGNQNMEIFIDGSYMYSKTNDMEKWIKQDIGGLMKQIKSLYGSNEPYNMSSFNKQQLEAYKDYAVFGEDVKIDGKDYYVIKIDLDKETYRKLYKEITDKILDSMIELQRQNQDKNSSEQGQMSIDMLKQIVKQITEQMEVEVSYKFYINKETKNYEMVDLVQDVYMPMDNLLKMLMQTMEEGKEKEQLKNVKITMNSHFDGRFKLYDFNGEVSFPEIKPEDIADSIQIGNIPVQEDIQQDINKDSF